MYFPEYFLYKFSSLELTLEGLIARQLVQLAYTKKTICGCSLAVTSTGLGWFIGFVVLCLRAPEGSTSSGSGLIHLRRWGHSLVSYETGGAKDRTNEPWVQGR